MINLLNRRIQHLENKCKMYEEMLTSLTASTQALYEVLVVKKIIKPDEDSGLFEKSHAKNVAFFDQMLAAVKDQLST